MTGRSASPGVLLGYGMGIVPGSVSRGRGHAASASRSAESAASALGRLRPGDREIAEVVGPEPALDEVHEPLLGGGEGAVSEKVEALGVGRRQLRHDRDAVDRERAAVVFEHVAGLGLRDPGAELDLGQAERRRHADHRQGAHGRAPGFAVPFRSCVRS